MKKFFVEIGIFIFKIIYYFLLQWFIPQKTLNLVHGWDTLHPFSKYSYGGVPRKDFLILYKKMKNGIRVYSNDCDFIKYGTLNPSAKQKNLNYERQRLTYHRFSLKGMIQKS